MAQFTKGIYRITQIPALHSLIQGALGGSDIAIRVVNEIIKPAGGEDVLDLGCGTGNIYPLLNARRYIGVDLNAAHIRAAKQTFPQVDFRTEDAIVFLESTGETFDLVTAVGFLHHLDDSNVLRLMAGIKRVLRHGGRFVALDPGFATGQHPVARLMAKLDSGRNIRTLDGYLNLERQVFEDASAYMRHDLLRIPYTHVITTCSPRG